MNDNSARQISRPASWFTPGKSFDLRAPIISTTVFHWFTSTDGHVSGPWPPLGGRRTWTGEKSWWMGQIKQIMMAHIDVIYVHLIEKFEQQRINLFAALAELRSNGYDVPKVVPFLDPFLIWSPKRVDVSSKVGKDELVGHYVRFFEQYFSVNTDPHAASYLARIDKRVALASWWTYTILDKVERLRREDIEKRLHAHFRSRTSLFSSGVYFISSAQINPEFSFADERLVMFSGYSYALISVHNHIHAYHLQAGYWDQNIRRPGFHLPRLGGEPYRNAWDDLLHRCNPVHRVYIESWNEYDEGSGIYAADPHTVHKPEQNRSPIADQWSSVGDPYEYIRTTARGVTVLKNVPGWASNVLECPQRISCQPGERLILWVTFRNTGATTWKTSAPPLPKIISPVSEFTTLVVKPEPTPVSVDLDSYGGVFRGAPMSYRIQLNSPTRVGDHRLAMRLHNSEGEPFGDAVEVRFQVQ